MKALKKIIDLRSDTSSKMSESMLNALHSASVGNDVYRDDPTLNQLQDTVAKMFGKEKGLLTASGTMSNLLSIMSHCNRGESVVIGEHSHINVYEQGNISSIAGNFPLAIPENSDGTLDFGVVQSKLFPPNQHFTKTTLVAFENTYNYYSGLALPLSYPPLVKKFATQHSLKTHLDGSRILNAYYEHKASNPTLKVSDLTDSFDSVCMCLSKSLRCPLGSVLVGSEEFINRAHRWRKALGGSFRQAGYLAAAALKSIEEAEEFIPRDHANAKLFGSELEKLGHKVNPVKTNFVIFYPKTSLTVVEYAAKAKEVGVLLDKRVDGSIRCVFYDDIKTSDLHQALEILKLIS